MDFTRENNKNLLILPSVSMLIVVMLKINLFISFFFFLSRLKLEERRKELLQKLEETTKLTTYLHSQLKK